LTDWIKVKVDHVQHPKIQELSDAAYRWLQNCWAYAGKYETDGTLPPGYVRTIPPRVRRELDASNLWYQNGTPGGRTIHDWLQHQPSKAKLDADRKAAASRQQSRRDATRDSHL
jgi:hypothetical protein